MRTNFASFKKQSLKTSKNKNLTASERLTSLSASQVSVF